MPADMEKPVQIGALARQLGITTRTIRYYEEIGLMGAAARQGGGPRIFSRDDVLRLKFILKLKELGISLKEMQALAENYDIHAQEFDSITPQLLEILDDHIARIDSKISSLKSLRLEILTYRQRIEAILRGEEAPVRS